MDSISIEMNYITYRWMYDAATNGNTIPLLQDIKIF